MIDAVGKPLAEVDLAAAQQGVAADELVAPASPSLWRSQLNAGTFGSGARAAPRRSSTMGDKYFIRPVFRVRSVAASVAYYCEKLGCSKRWDHGEDEPIIAEVERGDLSVILDSDSAVPKPAGPSVLTLSVENLMELHRELVGRGANIVTPLFEVIWQKNAHQFDVADLDGNLLVFWGNKSG